MKLVIDIFSLLTSLAVADIPMVKDSLSPDRKIHAVMDIDRDSNISPEWKADSFPQIEITRKDTGQILASVGYFGAAASDARPLREHVRVIWRPDSKAFAVTIDDRFYSHTKVFVLNKNSKFVEISFPSYKEMTGFPVPNTDQLRPRGRTTVEGWDAEGKLIYSIFMSPLPSYSGDDPLQHKVLLEVSPFGMTCSKNPKAEQGGAGNPLDAQ